MEEVVRILKEREVYLKKIKKQKEKELARAPEGFLRICSSGKNVQYYLRTDPKNFNGTYIKEKDRSLAEKLAQKDYNKKILQAAQKELQAIVKYKTNYPSKCIEEIYDSLHKERQKLILPIEETDEQFVSNWEKEEYEGKRFGINDPELYTAKGERVRSKSEVIIADLLNKEGLPYRYEYPLYLKEFNMVYPDFTILNVGKRKDIYWEHFGMMDDPDYVEKAIRKIALYEQNEIYLGDNLIATFETRKSPMNQKMAASIINRMLK